MAVTGGKLKITYTDDAPAVQSFEIRKPTFGYKTIIDLIVDIEKITNGHYSIYDYGVLRDRYTCKCMFILPASEYAAFIEPLRKTTKARASVIELELNPGSGFFPWGPQHGDSGLWNSVGIEAIEADGIGEMPYKEFKVGIDFFQLVPSTIFPAYTPTAQPKRIGPVTLGSVANIPLPQRLFDPVIEYKFDPVRSDGSGAEFFTQGEDADSYDTGGEFDFNVARGHDFLEYLLGTARMTAFNMTVPADCYPFGQEKGGGPFQVQLIQSRIEITHADYNIFKIPLNFNWVSG